MTGAYGEFSQHVVRVPSREVELQHAGFNRLSRAFAEVHQAVIELPFGPSLKYALEVVLEFEAV